MYRHPGTGLQEIMVIDAAGCDADIFGSIMRWR